jgi:hypothetical protein
MPHLFGEVLLHTRRAADPRASKPSCGNPKLGRVKHVLRRPAPTDADACCGHEAEVESAPSAAHQSAEPSKLRNDLRNHPRDAFPQGSLGGVVAVAQRR